MPNPANPQSLNRYSYCLNNPLKYVDPSGHDQQISATGTTNAAGQEGYFICDGQGNLLAVAYGMDDLAAKMSAVESQSRGVDLPVTKQTVDTIEPDSATPPSFVWPGVDNPQMAVTGFIVMGLAADDASGVGVVDDIAIPIILLGGYITAVAVTNSDYFGYYIDKAGDAISDALNVGIMWFKEHNKGARKSTHDQHTGKRSGAPEKKDQKPGWQDRSGKRK